MSWFSPVSCKQIPKMSKVHRTAKNTWILPCRHACCQLQWGLNGLARSGTIHLLMRFKIKTVFCPLVCATMGDNEGKPISEGRVFSFIFPCHCTCRWLWWALNGLAMPWPSHLDPIRADSMCGSGGKHLPSQWWDSVCQPIPRDGVGAENQFLTFLKPTIG